MVGAEGEKYLSLLGVGGNDNLVSLPSKETICNRSDGDGREDDDGDFDL